MFPCPSKAINRRAYVAQARCAKYIFEVRLLPVSIFFPLYFLRCLPYNLLS